MGKTPKKAAPGGDERNLYVRRLKATNAPSKASEHSLSERQRESESLNRLKLSGVQKRIPGPQGKGLKKKVHGTEKVGLNPTKRLGRPPSTSKEEKSLLLARKSEEKEAKMQTESEDAEVKSNVPIENEDNKESADKESTDKDGTDSVASKECVDHTSSENTSQEEPTSNIPENNKGVVIEDEQVEVRETEDVAQNTSSQSKESEECEENEIKLSYDGEEGTAKVADETPNGKESRDESKEELHSPYAETKSGTSVKEELRTEMQKDTESCSVDIVESTTSDVLETSEAVSQTDTLKEKKSDQMLVKETPSVSYDSSIMLKDVQIKLNDCLKENSKVLNATQEDRSTPTQSSKDQSFGKTLRGISGRNSISRMRYITTRDQRLTPNSSLFVNTSTMSFPQDETTDFKILRYSSGLSDTLSTNGSPIDRKRKLDAESWSSTKKQKTAESENSFLNTPISLLKGLRKPVQVSTPNVAPYKFESKNKLLTADDDRKVMNESMESTKKWCVIM